MYSDLHQGRSDQDWRAITLFVATLFVVALCAAIFYPFLPAITWAVALAVLTRAPYGWLENRVPNRTAAATIGIILVVLLIVAPAFFVLQNLGQRVIQVVSLVQTGEAGRWLEETRDKYPKLEYLVEQVSGRMDLRQAAQSSAGFLTRRARDILTGSAKLVTQLTFMLFTLFFLFRDRAKVVAALRWLLPFTEIQTEALLQRLTEVLSASVQGRMLIALIQGALGGLMFWILGVPEALLATMLMTLVAMIPSIGTFFVWMPVSVYLMLAGHWVKAIVLFGWGALVVSTIDNVLYPALVGSKLNIHTAPLFFSVFGGIALFGVSGLLLGPLILATFIALLQIWKNELPSEQRSTSPVQHNGL